ncbi:hypothetical protein KW94_06875 [Clostridioides difficile]|nr:hypothetical protein KW94_06875 [Clostridioides difficile]
MIFEQLSNTEIKRNKEEIMIDNDIERQHGENYVFNRFHHVGFITIGSVQYKYTRRPKNPLLVAFGENPYAYTLENYSKNINI